MGARGGHVEDFGAANGTRDGRRALQLATDLGQPTGSAIYFAVDSDFVKPLELAGIRDYFQAAAAAIGEGYRIGVYGSGKVGGMLLDRGLAPLVWLSGSMGWSGTREMLATDRWALFQKELDRSEFGISHDGNIASPAHPDFGQFRPWRGPAG